MSVPQGSHLGTRIWELLAWSLKPGQWMWSYKESLTAWKSKDSWPPRSMSQRKQEDVSWPLFSPVLFCQSYKQSGWHCGNLTSPWSCRAFPTHPTTCITPALDDRSASPPQGPTSELISLIFKRHRQQERAREAELWKRKVRQSISCSSYKERHGPVAQACIRIQTQF